MGRQRPWVLGAVVGVLAVTASALMLLAAVAVALLIVPLARRPGGLAAISGALTGFGSLWLLVMARQALTGGALDNGAAWAAVGALPLLAGLASLIWIYAGTGRRQPSG